MVIFHSYVSLPEGIITPGLGQTRRLDAPRNQQTIHQDPFMDQGQSCAITPNKSSKQKTQKSDIY